MSFYLKLKKRVAHLRETYAMPLPPARLDALNVLLYTCYTHITYNNMRAAHYTLLVVNFFVVEQISKKKRKKPTRLTRSSASADYCAACDSSERKCFYITIICARHVIHIIYQLRTAQGIYLTRRYRTRSVSV